MTCRIGMTMDPNRRQQEWFQHYPDLKNWVCYGPYNKSEARMGNNEAVPSDGEAPPSEAGDEHADWYVYYFEH